MALNSGKNPQKIEKKNSSPTCSFKKIYICEIFDNVYIYMLMLSFIMKM